MVYDMYWNVVEHSSDFVPSTSAAKVVEDHSQPSHQQYCSHFTLVCLLWCVSSELRCYLLYELIHVPGRCWVGVSVVLRNPCCESVAFFSQAVVLIVVIVT